jgi:hypothetical protein
MDEDGINWLERAERRREYWRRYQQRPEVQERAAELREARKQHRMLPRKRANALEHKLTDEELVMLKTVAYEDLPVPLKEFLMNDTHLVKDLQVFTQLEREFLLNVPYEDLPTALRQHIEEIQWFVNHNPTMFDVEAARDYRRNYYNGRYRDDEEFRARHLEAVKAYQKTPEGRAAQQKAQREYQQRKRKALKPTTEKPTPPDAEQQLENRRKAQREYQKRKREANKSNLLPPSSP